MALHGRHHRHLTARQAIWCEAPHNGTHLRRRAGRTACKGCRLRRQPLTQCGSRAEPTRPNRPPIPPVYSARLGNAPSGLSQTIRLSPTGPSRAIGRQGPRAQLGKEARARCALKRGALRGQCPPCRRNARSRCAAHDGPRHCSRLPRPPVRRALRSTPAAHHLRADALRRSRRSRRATTPAAARLVFGRARGGGLAATHARSTPPPLPGGSRFPGGFSACLVGRAQPAARPRPQWCAAPIGGARGGPRVSRWWPAVCGGPQGRRLRPPAGRPPRSLGNRSAAP